jgi:hypothetical protein
MLESKNDEADNGYMAGKRHSMVEAKIIIVCTY